jgi:hypothetical protein
VSSFVGEEFLEIRVIYRHLYNLDKERSARASTTAVLNRGKMVACVKGKLASARLAALRIWWSAADGPNSARSQRKLAVNK